MGSHCPAEPWLANQIVVVKDDRFARDLLVVDDDLDLQARRPAEDGSTWEGDRPGGLGPDQHNFGRDQPPGTDHAIADRVAIHVVAEAVCH